MRCCAVQLGPSQVDRSWVPEFPYGETKDRRPGVSGVWPSTVRSGEWPAWFFFWFSGRWRALAKGTAWAGFYRAVLLLLGFVVSSRPSRGKPRQMATYEVPF